MHARRRMIGGLTMIAVLIGSAHARGQDHELDTLYRMRSAVMAEITAITTEMAQLSQQMHALLQFIQDLEAAQAKAGDDAEYAALQLQIRQAYNRLSLMNMEYDALAEALTDALDLLTFINGEIERIESE